MRRCDDDLFPPLSDVVTTDVRRMTEALEESGYRITQFGLSDGPGQEPTRSRISRAIARACDEAPEGGVLLIYFSGHGVVLDGRQYLVPRDPNPDMSGKRPDPESLLPMVPAYVERCRARLVVFLVDACREDPAAALDEAAVGGSLPHPPNGTFVLISGCRAGQRCLWSDTGSYFTQALAEVLQRRHPARTVNDVFAEVERRMRRKAAHTDGMDQLPDIVRTRRGPGSDADDDVAICEGDQLTEAWRRAVVDGDLWRTSAMSGDLRAALLGVVEEAAERWRASHRQLRTGAGIQDPWSDEYYPVRVLATIERLLEGVALTDEERAALIAVPFLREAVYAEGVREAAGLRLTDFDRTYADGPRQDLEVTHAMHEHVCRRAEGLARRGDTAARDALTMWLAHRWLGVRPTLWRGSATRTTCTTVAKALVAGTRPSKTDAEWTSVLPVLLHTVGADARDQLLRQRLDGPEFTPRLRGLTAVVWLAGIAAVDPRRLPSVVVDHVGIGSGLSLPTVHAATARLSWEPAGDEWRLTAVCEHPALHAGFADVVVRAEQARDAITSMVVDPEVCGRLPARFSDVAIRPELPEGSPAYDLPLSRFRLSDEKVRELLMGRQLYGDPALAVRELYQNALDACRYRDVRRRYISRTNGQCAPWDGAITFVQDVDDTGRHYIECRDNGVGMSDEMLKSTFASAGERFVYRQDFRYEQALWQALKPPLQLIPNSQFGVGVFSYFMIAEEIEIVTRPVNSRDIPSQNAYSVRIASSGSLFRIAPAPERMLGGGTRVRLFLTEDERVSALRTMRQQLWVSEFRVEVREGDAGVQRWEPDELRHADTTVAPRKCGDELWWVSGDGGLAADGIRTGEEMYGLVVNLRDRRRPQFTVDRNKLRNWDKDWVQAEIHRSLPALTSWPGLTLSWLWKVTESSPAIAQDIFAHLVEADVALRVEGTWGHGVTARPGQVGCLPLDDAAIGLSRADAADAWLSGWRTAVWRDAGLRPRGDRSDAPVSVAGYPVVEPIDADLLAGLRSLHGWRGPTIDDLLERVGHKEQTAATRLTRIRRFLISGVSLPALRSVPPVDRTFDDEELPLLRAAAAWSPPGEAPPHLVVGPLGQATRQMNIPLGEVRRRVSSFMPAGWVAPEIDPALDDHVFTAAEMLILSQDCNGLPPWLDGPASPSHVVRAGAARGVPVGQVLQDFDRLAALGCTVAGRHLYPDDLRPVEVEALRYVHGIGQTLTAMHLLVLACRLSLRVDEVVGGLSRLAGGMLRLPDLTGPGGDGRLSDVKPSEEEQDFVLGRLRQDESFIRVPNVHSGWDAVALIVARIGSPEEHSHQRQLGRYRRLLSFTSAAGPLPGAVLVDLAVNLELALAPTAAHLRRLLPRVDLTGWDGVLSGPAGTLCPSWDDRNALLCRYYDINGRRVPTWEITPGNLVDLAVDSGESVGSILRRLEPYRALGAPLPELDEAVLRACEEWRPDRHDRAMLLDFDCRSVYFGDNEFLRTITPLTLVRIAGRSGWTPAETFARLARLVPCGLRLDVPATACPDETVLWQDLVLLTAHLDGREPMVTEPVTAEHVAAVAAETGETEDWVRSRLRLYSPILLAQPPDPTTETTRE